MRRRLVRTAAQAGMFVFIVVLAALLHPALSRLGSDLVWFVAVPVVLGLLLLPGWLLDRRHKPERPKVVKVYRSFLLADGGQLFVSSTGIGPSSGFRGFRVDVVYGEGTRVRRRTGWRKVGGARAGRAAGDGEAAAAGGAGDGRG